MSPSTTPRGAALAPPQRRQRTLEAVKRLLLRESRVQPLLLLFEDLHWTDSESQALLDGLIESLPTARILLVDQAVEQRLALGISPVEILEEQEDRKSTRLNSSH